MDKRWLLFDASSIAWQCLLAGKDKEFGRTVTTPEGKSLYVNSAEYGFDNFVSSFEAHLRRFEATPRDCVFVLDGKSAKLLRQSINPDYKAGRDHAPESYEQFGLLMERIKDTILGLGGLVVWQDGMEADDVLCYLSQILRSTVISNDGDLLALQNEHTDVYNTGRDTLNENKYGPFAPKFITLYKALVGDPSDNIKGALKFGEKAFIDLLCTFREEGLEALVELIRARELEKLAEDVGELKCLQRIIDSKDSVYQSWDLACMYPEKVNTMRKPLQVSAGMVRQWDPSKHDERLKSWYGASRLVHAGNYDQAIAWAMEKLLESPEVSTDIETSVNDESDEWMAAKKRGQAGEDGKKSGVDVLGSKLTGLSLTFGRNCQYSLYFPVNHAETDSVKNVTSEQVRQFMELIPDSKPNVVHNASFELSVLFQEWGKAWEANGWHGFLPNVYDTKVMKSYVDENTPSGLKPSSLAILGYTQTTYDEVTKGRRMNQMTAQETVGYGNDDTICTVALFNYFRFMMALEGTLKVYEEVERKPAYLNAFRFVQGTPISIERMLELEKEDKVTAEKAWAVVRDFLMKRGWEGTVCPEIGKPEDLTAARIKEAFSIVCGGELRKEDGKAVMIRTPEKLAAFIGDLEHHNAPILASVIGAALAGDYAPFNGLLKSHFDGEPQFNPDSPKQMQHLLYDVMGLPVRLRNKPTEEMRKKGLREGNPKADDFALQFAIKFDAERGPEILGVLKAIQDMRVMATRTKLFYTPYRHVRHWMDNLVHPQINQCATVTRRYSASDPNLQQLPKNAKHGHDAKFRQVYVPHRKNAVVVSLDFKAQELVSIAEQSQDPNLVACFAPPSGQKKKDMHALTATAIWKKKPVAELCRMAGYPDEERILAAARWSKLTYDDFMAIYKDESNPDSKLASELRQLGKKTNFTTEYGAQAPKLAQTLIIEEAEAQQYIEAKAEQFPRAEAWKREVVDREVNKLGYTTTLLGARRHLREAVLSTNRIESSGAERQGVNFKVQGSCAEQTKLTEARIWDSGVLWRYDCRYIGPIHDEVVFSVAVEDLLPWIREVHALMTQNYAGMRLPIVSSISIGPNFGEQIECGDDVDEEAITKALRQIGFEANMTTA